MKYMYCGKEISFDDVGRERRRTTDILREGLSYFLPGLKYAIMFYLCLMVGAILLTATVLNLLGAW